MGASYIIYLDFYFCFSSLNRFNFAASLLIYLVCSVAFYFLSFSLLFYLSTIYFFWFILFCSIRLFEVFDVIVFLWFATGDLFLDCKKYWAASKIVFFSALLLRPLFFVKGTVPYTTGFLFKFFLLSYINSKIFYSSESFFSSSKIFFSLTVEF